jgi:hypothetical protein
MTGTAGALAAGFRAGFFRVDFFCVDFVVVLRFVCASTDTAAEKASAIASAHRTRLENFI